MTQGGGVLEAQFWQIHWYSISADSFRLLPSGDGHGDIMATLCGIQLYRKRAYGKARGCRKFF